MEYLERLYFAASLHSISNSSMSLVRKQVYFWVLRKGGFFRPPFSCARRRGSDPFLFLPKCPTGPMRVGHFGGLRADGANGLSVGAKGYFHSRVTGTDGKNACVIA